MLQFWARQGNNDLNNAYCGVCCVGVQGGCIFITELRFRMYINDELMLCCSGRCVMYSPKGAPVLLVLIQNPRPLLKHHTLFLISLVNPYNIS